MSTDFAIKYMPIIPSYSQIFGAKPKPDDLIKIIQQIPLFEWLNFLSRIQAVLAGDRVQNNENQMAVLHGVFTDRLRNSILDFHYRHDSQGQLIICYERQLSTLQQMVFLYASEEGDGSFENEKERELLGVALLMVIDLMDIAIEENDAEENIVAGIIQQQTRMNQRQYWLYFARAYFFYELDSLEQSSYVKNYLSLFEISEGVDPRDFLLGGMILGSLEILRTNKDQSEGWQAILPSDQRENQKERRLVDTFLKIRCAPPKVIKNFALRIENDHKINDWNLISLYRYPICNFDQKGNFIINLTALGKSLFYGIRHAILTAALEKRLPDEFNSIKSIGGLYGQLFEKYIFSILEEAFPGRVIKIIENDYPGNADCLICFPDKIIIAEIKSEHFLAKQHNRLMRIEERKSELQKTGILKGVNQISATIKNLRSFSIKIENLPYYDWTTTRIIPLLITEEELPSFPLCWKWLYDDIETPLKSLQNGSGIISRLRFISIEEIEVVPNLNANKDFATLLLQWAFDPEKWEYSFKNYLHSCNCSWSEDFMYAKWKGAFKYLAEVLGFDSSRL